MWETPFTKRETAVDTQDTHCQDLGSSLCPGPGGPGGLPRRGMEHVAATPHSSLTFFLPLAPAAHTCLPHISSEKKPRHSGIWCVAIPCCWSSDLICLCSLTIQCYLSIDFIRCPSPRSCAPKTIRESRENSPLFFVFPWRPWVLNSNLNV